MTDAASATPTAAAATQTAGNWPEVFLAFLRLGLMSFGGPIAHLGYFRQDIVERRRWLDGRAYADLVALCQFLPGPTSSEVGIGIGLTRAGLAGAEGGTAIPYWMEDPYIAKEYGEILAREGVANRMEPQFYDKAYKGDLPKGV
jgi:hypothetical protein